MRNKKSTLDKPGDKTVYKAAQKPKAGSKYAYNFGVLRKIKVDSLPVYANQLL